MTYARKTLSEIKLIHGNYGNFIKGQKLDKKKEKKYKTPPYQDLAASNEIDGEPLDEKCWPGYEKKGMKTMFGKRYPNCVKKKKTRKEEYSDWRSELESIQERKIGKGKDEFFIDSTGKKKRMSQATRQDVGMAPKDPINVTPTGFRAKVDNAKNFLKQKVKLPKSASKVPGVKGAAKLLSKTPKGALVAAGLLGAVAGARAIGRKFNEIRKKRKDAAIDKQVDKYVADRRKPISNIPKKEGDAVIDGKKLNPDFKKKPEIKKEGPKVSEFTRQGKKRTPAQMMAAKRKAEGKTIQQVKDENLQSIKNKAKLKNTDFQAMKKGDMSKDDFVKKYPNSNLAKKMKEGYELDERELQEKKVKPAPVKAPDMKYIMSHGMSDQTFANTANKVFSGKSETGKDGYSDQNKFTAELLRRQANTGKDFSGNPLYKKKEENKTKADVKSSYEYDAYDLVLEYLLSSEQVATIEEANYVMTEMDAETIQSIVEAQKKTS